MIQVCDLFCKKKTMYERKAISMKKRPAYSWKGVTKKKFLSISDMVLGGIQGVYTRYIMRRGGGGWGVTNVIIIKERKDDDDDMFSYHREGEMGEGGGTMAEAGDEEGGGEEVVDGVTFSEVLLLLDLQDPKALTVSLSNDFRVWSSLSESQ